MASLPALADSHTAELAFDGVAFILTVRCVGGDALEVVVERKEDAAMWSATFTAKYVEEITAKTGSFKRFPVFVKMLLSAARQESDSVFVDLLSYADLELLRSKRASAAGGGAAAAGAAVAAAGGPAPSASAAAAAATKRYLILTYAAEFDRVHYPLPLAFEEHPDPARLQATIRQLRAQLAVAGPGRGAAGLGRARGHSAGPSPSSATAAAPPELRQLRDENAALRARVAGLERQLEAGGGALAADVQALAADAQEAVADLRGLRRERDALLLRAQQAEAALEGERNLHRRELRRRARAAADLEAELGAAKDQIRELRLRCRELAQELDLAQRRAQVAAMSAGMNRQPGATRRLSGGGSTGGGGGGGGRGAAFTSPAGSRYQSRDISPAPIRRAPLPGPPPRSRSADVSRPSSRPTSRPGSAGRFDPTEYIRLKKEREREAARRLDDMRRSARLQSPRAGSLAGSRPPSMPSSRHSTPQRSRVPSRDPSADRARQRSAERSRPPQGDPRERAAAVRSTERLRAAVATTSATAPPAFPPRDQRSASPGRALQEVRQRLQQYAAAAQPAGAAGSAGGRPAAEEAAPAMQQRPRVPPTGDHYADASAEIADIDGRLQSLQAFLRSAKAGQPLVVPV